MSATFRHLYAIALIIEVIIPLEISLLRSLLNCVTGELSLQSRIRLQLAAQCALVRPN